MLLQLALFDSRFECEIGQRWCFSERLDPLTCVHPPENVRPMIAG